MENMINRVMFGSKVDKDLDSLDTKVVSDILTYLYGDKKNVHQIARRLDMHPMQIVYILECMLRQGVIAGIEEHNGAGIENYYTVADGNNNVEMQTKVSGNAQKIKIATEMGEQIRDVIISTEKGDCHYISYTVSMLTEGQAQALCSKQEKLENKMSEMEEENIDSSFEKEKYIMITTIAPYKLDEEQEANEG